MTDPQIHILPKIIPCNGNIKKKKLVTDVRISQPQHFSRVPKPSSSTPYVLGSCGLPQSMIPSPINLEYRAPTQQHVKFSWSSILRKYMQLAFPGLQAVFTQLRNYKKMVTYSLEHIQYVKCFGIMYCVVCNV